jgi:hypothetical protein
MSEQPAPIMNARSDKTRSRTGPATPAMRALLDDLKKVAIASAHLDPRGDLLEIKLADLERDIVHEDPQLRRSARAELRGFLLLLENGKSSLRADRLLRRAKVIKTAPPPEVLKVNLAPRGTSIARFVKEARAFRAQNRKNPSPKTGTNGNSGGVKNAG